jgi:hypothetical protein
VGPVSVDGMCRFCYTVDVSETLTVSVFKPKWLPNWIQLVERYNISETIARQATSIPIP